MFFDDDRILFIDTRHIDAMENITLRLNPPEKRGACLSVETDWELRVSRASSIVFWQGSYRLYYTVKLDEMHSALAFATSTDGINWTRPDLDAVEFDGSRRNNLVDIQGLRPDETCVFIDPTGSYEHRFKVVCHSPFRGTWLMTSPDGIRFKDAGGTLIERATDNHMSVFYDPTIGKYRLYLRGSDKSRPIMGWSGSRSVIYAETDDLFKPIPIDENAPDPHERGKIRPGPDGKMIQPLAGINRELPKVMGMDDMDPPECDMYQPAAHHYARGAYLAFPTLYYHHPGIDQGGFHNDGILDIQFASSRDGYLWRRDFRGSYVRLDLPDGPATKQMHMLLGMVPHSYTLSQYYCGWRRSHGEGRTLDNIKGVGFHEPRPGDPIALRLEQRIDGFVSADSAYTGGSLLTTPFELKNAELRINVDTSASGVARAALLDDTGREIPGCRLEESDRIQGNDTKYVLSWRGQSDLSHLIGNKVRLLLKSRSTKLFAVYP
ncbi:MAG: hypothetical protein ACP5R5_10625 [Armatimonadota bacterium]